MNIAEFAALKSGDKIENLMNPGPVGEVTEAAPGGVRIVWGPRHPHETHFFYSVQTTAWMHWTLAEPDAVT